MGQISAILVFVGFNTTFLPQFVMGAQGMPRRYATYLPVYQPYHITSTVGAYIQLVGFIIAALCLLQSLMKGRKAPANPWGSATLEWSCSSPPPHDNFKVAPTVGDPYDLTNLIWDERIGGYVQKAPARPLAPAAH